MLVVSLARLCGKCETEPSILAGLLILGKKNLYLIDGLVQTPGGEVIDAKDAQKDVLSIPSGTLVELDADDQQSHCWYVT